ncbi:zf-HC2 domain-containing protein [Streptomyces sp. SLBN-31]|uniref:zf-HC2 domain-containing protein n=1 Tax=Streptomyces sp. SLBN-31 TaxID=2768444 RepID=UPI00114DBC99|nr:zf-HC2 domain-containing protein [Streptomyces sp. SLBN-31]TQJ92642.1 putative zinc finger protein [Streptomyces sp. SLBN-31]
MTHPTTTLLARYAEGGLGLDDAALWSIEVHLDGCADCRGQLAAHATPATTDLLDRVAVSLDRALGTSPSPARHRTRAGAVHRRWFAWTLLPWLAVTAAVLGCGVLLDAAEPSLPSLVLLLAPVAPLPGVAVAWSRQIDPAWELIATTPAAGLAMVLRRTLAVLVIFVPALLVAGVSTGTSLALTLLPCLAFTAATLVLGARIGVQRAAIALAVTWSVAVLLPSLAARSLSPVLQHGSTAFWAVSTVALAAIIPLTASHFRRLASGN